MTTSSTPPRDGSEELTRGEVARRLGLSPERVRQLTVTGALPCRVTALGRVYDARDVDEFDRQRREHRTAGAQS